MSRKTYEAAIVVTGNAKGGLTAIKLTEKQLDNLDKKLKTVNKSNTTFKKHVNDSNVSLHGFKSALVSVTTVALARYFQTSADQMQNIDARLRIVTSGMAEFNHAQTELVRISLETHSNLDTTARLYTRMQQSLNDMHVSQNQLLTVTQAMNQAFVVSGATAHEASAAIIQMTQALASGQLRGEEYRSVAEQATRILQVLQDELGKTRGELLLMAHTGKLTSELVINAMLNQSTTLQAEFDKIPVTIERAIQDTDTHFKKFVHTVDQATNASGLLAQGILLLGENFGEIATFIGIGLFVKLAVAMTRGVATAFAWRKAFGTAQVATLGMSMAVTKLNKSLSLLGGVWGIALFAGIEFVSWLMNANNEVDVFSDQYKDAMKTVKKATEDGFDFDDIPAFKSAISASVEEIEKLQAAIRKLRDENKGKQELINNSNLSFKEKQLFGFAQGQRIASNEAQITAIEAKYADLEKTLDDNINALRRVDDSFGLLDETVIRHSFNVEKLGATQGTLLTAWNLAKQGMNSLVQQQEKANKSIEDWITKATKQNEALELQIATFGLSSERVMLYKASLVDTTGASEDFIKAHNKILATLKKNVEILEQKQKAEKELSDFKKAEEKRLEKEDSERKKRLAEFTKNLEQAKEQLDPLGSLMQEYAEKSANTIVAWAEGSITITEASEALKLFGDQFKENKEKIDESIPSFDRLIQEMQEEIDLANATGDAQLELIAKRELGNKNIDITAEKIAELVAKYKELARAQGNGGAFGGGVSNFGEFLGNAFSSGNFFESISSGFSEMFSSPETFAEGFQSISGFITTALNAYNGAEGQDTAGQLLETATAVLALIPGWGQAIAAIAQAVNAITGGKLFGTAFETTGGQSQVNITNSGAGGFVETYQERERSLFRGTERRTITENIGGEAQQAVDALFANIGDAIATASSLLGVDVIDIISGSFIQEFDEDGNLTRAFSDLLGRTFNEGFEEFSARLLAENILAVINSALPQVERTFTEYFNPFGDLPERELGDLGPGFNPDDFGIEVEVTRMVDQASHIAERWRDNAFMLLEGSQFLLTASKRFLDGTNLFESLQQATDFVELNSLANETLSETYYRVIAAESIFTNTLERMGTTIGLTGEEFIQFSVDFVQAAGGVEAAGQLIGTYFDNFYSEQENNIFRLNNVFDEASSLLGSLELPTDLGLDEFRYLFESIIGELSPEDLTTWFEAGNALAALNQEIDRLVGLEQEYLDFISGFQAQLVELSSNTEYGVAMARLNIEYERSVEQANALAIAAGRAGASVEDLAIIQDVYAQQTELLVSQLRNQVLDLANQLYGSDLDDMIAELEGQQTQSIQTLNNEAQSMWESQIRAVRSISNMIDSLLINEQLSPLSRTDQFNEAFSQFNDLLSLAQGGDVDAMNALPSMATTLLQLARDVFASGGDYNEIFDAVITGLESIGVTLNQPPADTNTNVTLIPSEDLQALYREREERDAALYAQQRLELAQQLAVYLNELAGFLNQPLIELASELGISMAALVTDLGVNLEDLTVETTTQLAVISNMLGIELLELAESLGEDIATELGVLADSQSLLNDALEAQINALPQASAEFLAPFLEAIENATTEADANQAMQDMIDAIGTLPVDQSNLLAPFFEEINFIDQFNQQLLVLEAQRDAVINTEEILGRVLDEDEEQTAILTTANNHNLNQISLLESIDTGIAGVITAIADIQTQGTSGGTLPPQFAVGIRKLPTDQVAQLHAGETVLPASLVKQLEDFGIPVGAQQNQNGSVDNSVIQALVESNRLTQQALNELSTAISRSAKDNSDKIVGAIESNQRTTCR